MFPTFQKLFVGGQLSSVEMDRSFSELLQGGWIATEPPLYLDFTPTGPKIRIDLTPPINVLITGGTNPYSWQEEWVQPGGQWQTYTPSGLSGSAGIGLFGDITSGSATVINLSSTAGISANYPVCGPGIPDGTIVNSVDSGTQVTLSQNATLTALQSPINFNADAPLFERNGNRFVQPGTYVLARQGWLNTNSQNQDWIFEYCCSGGFIIWNQYYATVNINQNNYIIPNGIGWLLIASTGNVAFTGFTGGLTGRIVQFTNTGTKLIEIPNVSGSSSSGNQVYTPNGYTGGHSVFVHPQESILLKWDAVLNGWYIGERPQFLERNSTIVSTTSYTVLPSDHGRVIACQNTADTTITFPQMFDGFFCTVKNDLNDKAVYVNTAASQFLTLRYLDSQDFYSSGTTSMGSAPGSANTLTRSISSASSSTLRTMVANDQNREIVCTGSTAFTITIEARDTTTHPETAAQPGFRSIVKNLSSKLVTLTPNNSVTIDNVASIYLYPLQSVEVVFDGTSFQAPQGKQLSTLTSINAATYTIGPADYAMSLQVDYTAGNCAITWPASGLPADFFCQIYNNGGATRVTTIVGSSDAYALTYKRSAWLHSNGVGRVSALLGSTFYGVQIETTDYTITKADFNRTIACNPTAGSPFNVTLGNASTALTTVDGGFAVTVQNFGADIIAIKPPTGYTIDGLYTPSTPLGCLPRQGVTIYSDGDTVTTKDFKTLRGNQFTSTTIRSGTTDTLAVTDWGQNFMYTNTAAVAVSVPTTGLPAGWWCYISRAYPGAEGVLTATDDNGGKVLVRNGMSTMLLATGSLDITGTPGQTIMGMLSYTGNQAITWANQARMMVNTGGACTWTLDDTTTFNNAFTVLLRNRGTGVITVATTKNINNLGNGVSLVIPPCQSVILSCDGSKYEITTGYTCLIAYDVASTTNITSSYHGTVQNYTGNGDTWNLETSTLYPGFNFRGYTNQASGTLTIDANTDAGKQINGGNTVDIPQNTMFEVTYNGTKFTAGWL